MNKKGIIALVVVVLAIIGFFVFGKGEPTTVNNEVNSENPAPVAEVPAGVTKDDYKPVTQATSDTSLVSRLKNTSVGISEDGKKIGFINGTATFTSEGASSQTVAKVGDIAVEQSKSGRNDVLATVSLTTGGVSSTYLVLFLDNGTAGLYDKSYSLVGTNINVTGIRADSVADSNIDYVVSVSYTDSKKAAKSKLFIVAGGMIDSARTIEL